MPEAKADKAEVKAEVKMDSAWSEWQVLERTGPRSLRLAPTLLSGMSFRWWRRKEGEEEEETFLGVVEDTICELKELDAAVCFRSSNPDTDAACALLRKHLRLDDGVDACEVPTWREALPRFRRAAAAVPGCRVLRILDPLECLITFIGSANNNIKRNMQMVRDLCADFEENRLGADPYGGEHYSFPSVAQLLSLSEQRLWELGWGYRAPRVFKVARQLEERGGEPFLRGLPLEEAEARAALCELCGVGRKVADCILLFGYAHDSCVPVDCHCLQIAQRHLLRGKDAATGKALSASLYQKIVDRFHEVFGKEGAGWAFMTLFVAELSDFRKRLDQPEEEADELVAPTMGSVGSPHFHFPPSPGTRDARAPSGRPSTSGKGQPATPPPKKAKRRRAVAQSAPMVLPVAAECSTPKATRRSSRRTVARASPYFVRGR